MDALGTHAFADDAAAQVAFLAPRGHALYVDLVEKLAAWVAERGEGARALDATWRLRQLARGYERPLLLLAALRDRALAEPDTELGRVLADGTKATTFPRRLLDDALAVGSGIYATLATRFVQTNEVSRAVVWRWPLATALPGFAPTHLVDLGCSAGLNLVADRIDLTWLDAAGGAIDVSKTPIGERHGLDRAPIDVVDPREQRWLRACIWPFQGERLARFDAALAAAVEARARGDVWLYRVDARDMPAWLEELAARVAPDPVVAYQTSFASYLPHDVRSAYERDVFAWTARRPTQTAWLELEDVDPSLPDAAELPSALVLHRAGATTLLARCEPHPRVLRIEERSAAFSV